MTTTHAAALVAHGHAAEDRVAERLRSHGWTAALYGSRVENDPTILDAIVASRLPIRHAPDLIAARHDRGVVFVEVIDCNADRNPENRAIEVAKLESLNAWERIARVAVVDVGDWLSWWHRPGWAVDCVTDVNTRTGYGSGDPFAWFRRTGFPFDDMFGRTP